MMMIIIIMKHFLERSLPKKRGSNGFTIYTHTHTHMHLHPQHAHSHTLNSYKVRGGGIAPTINIKYMYNDENNTGKRKQNSNS